MQTSGPPEWLSNPKEVSAIEYVLGLLNAHNRAGLMIDHKHLYTIQQKLLTEARLPRIKALQILNRMVDLTATGEKEITLPVEDVRYILQMSGDLA